MTQVETPTDRTEVRPFPIDDVPEEELDYLRRRIAETRWPKRGGAKIARVLRG
jgi:hypothetical protein